MCNCGQKRMSLKNNPEAVYKNSVKVILTDSKSVVINGSITGRTYIFKDKGDINYIDKRDFIEIKNIKNLSMI